MGFLHLKRTRSLQNRSRLYPFYGLIAVALLLCIALGVTTFLKVKEGRQLQLAHEQLTGGIQSDLTMVLRTFDQINLPKADVKGTLLPTMRKHLYSAYAMNNVLHDVYGKSILSNEFYMQISGAIDALDATVTQGKLPGEATNALGVCMADIETRMSDGGLMPQTALK